MKIIKSQLKQIIKEELESTMTEAPLMTNDPRVTGTKGMHRFTGGKGRSPGSWTPTSGGDPDGDADDAAELRDIAADLDAKTGRGSLSIERAMEMTKNIGSDEGPDSPEAAEAEEAELHSIAARAGYSSYNDLVDAWHKMKRDAQRTQSTEDAYGVGGEEFKLRENKITKSQLKRIIKEELQSVLREGGAFASDEEIQDIVDVASKIDPDIQEFSEFYEAARIAWNEGRLKSRYEPSKHELRQAWKKHPGNRFTHDQRLR